MIPNEGRDPVYQQQTQIHCLKKLWLLFTSIVYLKRYVKLACLLKQTELIVIEIYIEVRKFVKQIRKTVKLRSEGILGFI